MMVLAYASSAAASIPEPLQVEEIQNSLVKVSLFLGIISSAAVIVSAIAAFAQWKKTKRFHKVEFIQSLRSKMYDDKDIAEVLHNFDYELEWYSEEFHINKHPQIEVDKTLSLLEYACYLLHKKYIDEEDMFQIKYDIDRAISNHQVQNYLYNLRRWIVKLEKEEGDEGSDLNARIFPYSNFLQYGIDNGFIGEDFDDENNSKYQYYDI